MEDRPEYNWLRELKRTRGAEFRRRFGAHSIGIGLKRVDSRPTDELALIVYVARKGEGPEPVPATIKFTPAGQDRPVELATDVVEMPLVEPEE